MECLLLSELNKYNTIIYKYIYVSSLIVSPPPHGGNPLRKHYNAEQLWKFLKPLMLTKHRQTRENSKDLRLHQSNKFSQLRFRCTSHNCYVIMINYDKFVICHCWMWGTSVSMVNLIKLLNIPTFLILSRNYLDFSSQLLINPTQKMIFCRFQTCKLKYHF